MYIGVLSEVAARRASSRERSSPSSGASANEGRRSTFSASPVIPATVVEGCRTELEDRPNGDRRGASALGADEDLKATRADPSRYWVEAVVEVVAWCLHSVRLDVEVKPKLLAVAVRLGQGINHRRDVVEEGTQAQLTWRSDSLPRRQSRLSVEVTALALDLEVNGHLEVLQRRSVRYH